MNYRTFNRSIALLVAVLISVAWPAASRAQVKAPSKQAGVSSSADEAERYFKKAHEDFLKKDRKAAAAEIREAAALLKREERRATSEGKKDLSASAQELEKLATDVENGTVTSVKELDNAFARAHYALARHHYLKASKSWAEKEADKAGHELKAAAADLERGLTWAGHKAEAGTKTVINNTRILGEKLIKGAGWVSAEVGKGIEDLGKEIEKLGKKTEPAKK